MRYPAIIDAYRLIESGNNLQTEVHRVWVPARCNGMMTFRMRCRAAWLVFTGKADALVWPGQ